MCSESCNAFDTRSGLQASYFVLYANSACICFVFNFRYILYMYFYMSYIILLDRQLQTTTW